MITSFFCCFTDKRETYDCASIFYAFVQWFLNDLPVFEELERAQVSLLDVGPLLLSPLIERGRRFAHHFFLGNLGERGVRSRV